VPHTPDQCCLAEKISKEHLMYPIRKRGCPALDCSTFAGVRDSQRWSSIAVRESIELCRKTDVILARLNQPVLRFIPIIAGIADRSGVVGPPKDWTKESVLKLIRNPATGPTQI
jgi:hypothetical protein